MELEAFGRPTVTIVSEAFEPLAKAERGALGLPDLPLAVVPHPVASRPVDELEQLGHALLPRIIEGLTERLR